MRKTGKKLKNQNIHSLCTIAIVLILLGDINLTLNNLESQKNGRNNVSSVFIGILYFYFLSGIRSVTERKPFALFPYFCNIPASYLLFSGICSAPR